MRTIYINLGGHGYLDNIKPRFTIVEEPDGFHPISKESVWLDIDRLDDGVVLIWQGITAPEKKAIDGDPHIEAKVKETEIARINRQKIRVSKRFARRLMSALVWFGRFLYFIGVMSGILFMLFFVMLVLGVI